MTRTVPDTDMYMIRGGYSEQGHDLMNDENTASCLMQNRRHRV